MKIFLTGQPRSGKTTLLSKLLAEAKNKQGFVTEEIRDGGERVGFKLVSADGREAVLAHVDHESPYKVSRYYVDVRTLDQFIEPLFSISEGQLLYIDEIGQMELFSDRFKELANLYLDSDNRVLGTITSVYSDDYTEAVKARDDVEVTEITPANRDQLLVELEERLF
jgi:nucleoside-triphosphatase